VAKKFTMSPEARQKIREARLGTKIPAETRAKISATMRRKWKLIEQFEAERQRAGERAA
jgi:hypothetical protein